MGLIPEKKYLEHYLSIEGLAEKVYTILTSKEFSREKPHDPLGIKERLEYFLLEEYYPIQLLGLWGGSKESKTMEADEVDDIALENLKKVEKSLSNAIAELQTYKSILITTKGVRIKILFCDAHHIVANRISLQDSLTYYNSLKELTDKYHFEISRLCGEKLLGLEPQISHYICPFIDYVSDEKSRTKARTLFTNKDFAEKLSQNAAKHSLWVKEDKFPAEKIARLYTEMEIYFLNLLDRKGLGDVFNRFIYFSYSDPEIQRPLAEAAGVPMLFFHSLGKGHHECPWYSETK